VTILPNIPEGGSFGLPLDNYYESEYYCHEVLSQRRSPVGHLRGHMPPNSLNHVSVPALELEESVEFYVELFGPENCERIPSPDFGVPVPVQWLRIGDREIHLFVLPIPIAARYYHFGVSATGVEQFERIYRLAKERGILDTVTYGGPVFEMPGGCAQLYVIDPAGNLVEIDWVDASQIDRSVVTEMQRISDRGPQSEESLRSSLFLEKLARRGWRPSGQLPALGGGQTT